MLMEGFHGSEMYRRTRRAQIFHAIAECIEGEVLEFDTIAGLLYVK